VLTARARVAAKLGVAAEEIAFTRNATEALRTR
jgi:selenocysteine lyase/cysteine desulfurase